MLELWLDGPFVLNLPFVCTKEQRSTSVSLQTSDRPHPAISRQVDARTARVLKNSLFYQKQLTSRPHHPQSQGQKQMFGFVYVGLIDLS